MSLMNTVTKMALGFAVAKGMEAVQSKGGIGSIMEELAGGASGQSGGLGDILAQLGGAGGAGTGTSQAGSMGGLGDILGQLGAAGGAGTTGGLGDVIGALTGGGAGTTSAAGGLGGLGGLLAGLAGARGGAAPEGFEDLINQDNPADEPDEEMVAKLMLRALIQSARADGDIDADEKEKLFDLMQDGDPSDMAVVREILEEPVNAAALAADTPKGLETQVYTMSVNAISPDNQAEAQYLHSLAEGLGIQPDTVNKIHDSLGVPRLYR